MTLVSFFFNPNIFDERKIQRGYESLLNRVFSAFDGHTWIRYRDTTHNTTSTLMIWGVCVLQPWILEPELVCI